MVPLRGSLNRTEIEREEMAKVLYENGNQEKNGYLQQTLSQKL